MADSEKVTVDKAYFDALLRRANCHSSSDPAGGFTAVVSISSVEYTSLLRASQDYDRLRSALFQGDINAETLDLLISNPQTDITEEPPRQLPQSFTCPHSNDFQFFDHRCQYAASSRLSQSHAALDRSISGPIQGFFNANAQQSKSCPRVRSSQRQTSYGITSDAEYGTPDDEEEEFGEDGHPTEESGVHTQAQTLRTLFLSGLSARTTYRDLTSSVHGGKILSIVLRPDRTALVTFVEGAAQFLTWVKRHDLFVNSKRIEVKWAERQYLFSPHIEQRIANGASRNILIRNATARGLTEQQIRDDMEHIHGLVIIDIVFHDGDAVVSTNSIHNALFARTCMMSRSSYKGCKIGFIPDECDVQAPMTTSVSRPQTSLPRVEDKRMTSNRFDLLSLDDEGT